MSNEDTKDCTRLPVVAWRCTVDNEHYALFSEKKCRFCRPLWDGIDAQALIAELEKRSTERQEVAIELARLLNEAGKEIRDLKDRYDRDVHGLNNEGDAIGGEPAGGYVNQIAELRAENADLSNRNAWQADEIKRQTDRALKLRDERDALRSHIRTDNSETLVNALEEIERLERAPAMAELRCDVAGHAVIAEQYAEALAKLQAAPAERGVVQVCKLGAFGSAYDMPETYRAFTYAMQPGNPIAWKLGRALSDAHKAGGGDWIDYGLGLLKTLQGEGFGVFQIAEPATADSDVREVSE